MLRFLPFYIIFIIFFHVRLSAQNPCATSNWGTLLSDNCGTLLANGGFAPNSPFIFCEGEVVTVENNSSPMADIQKTYIDWGDGTCEVFNGFQAAMTHAYDFPNDTCVSSPNGTIVFDIKLGVERSCTAGKSFNRVTFSAVVRFKPVANFTASPSSLCVNAPVTFNNQSCENSANPMYLWNFGDGTTSTLENPPPHTYATAGSYTVTLQVSNECGPSTYTRTIAVTPPATAVATASATQICAGQTVTMTNTSVNANSYTWTVTPSTGTSFVMPTNSSSTNPIIRFNTPGTYTVKLKVNGCGNPEWTTMVEVLAPASVNIATIPDNCAAGNVSITPTATIGGTNTNVTWSFPGGTPSTFTGSNPGTINYPGQGTFIVTATASNFCGMITDMDTFSVAPQATAAFSASTTDLCGPDDILSLTNTSANGSSYTWTIMPNSGFSYVNGTSSTSMNPQLKFTAEGNYTIKLRVNACGNPETTQTVNVRLKPSVSIVNTLDKCEQSVMLSPASLVTIGGGAATSTEWTFLNGSIPSFSGTMPPAVTFSGVNVFAVALTLSNTCGSQTVVDTFHILPLATAAATISDDTLCGPTELLILTNNSASAFSNNPYSWMISPNNGYNYVNSTTSGSANPQIEFTQEGQYTVSLAVNGCGMPQWDTTVNVILLPTVTVAAIPEGCVDVVLNPLDFATLSGGAPASVQWVFGGATPATASGIMPPSVNFTGYGTHFIQATVTNACGTATAVDSFNIIEPSMVSAMAAGPFCNTDAPVQLQATPTGGSWSGPGVSMSGLFTPSAALLNMPSVIIYQVGAATCTVYDTVEIQVRGTLVDAGADRSVCSNSGLLTLNTFSPAGGVWTGDTVTVGGVFDPLIAGNGPKVLTYTYTDTNTGCVNSDEVTITVLGVPAASLDSIGRTCVDEPLDLGAFGGGGSGNSCSWDFGDGNTAAICNPVHTYTSPGNFTLVLYVENPAGCKDTATVDIQVVTPPNALFTTDTTQGCADLPITISNNSAINDYTLYIWNYGNGVTDTLAQPGTIVFTQGETDTTYTITLQSVNGCGTANDQHAVTVFPRPQVRFGSDVSSGCTPLEVNFNNVSVGEPDFFQWYVNGTPAGTDFQLPQQVFLTTDHDSTYYIALVAGNECGLDTVIHSVLVKPNPVTAFFNTDTLIGCQPFEVRLIDYSTEGLYISWDWGDGTLATGDTVVHTFNVAGQYTVQEFVNNGCGFDTASVSITVLPAPVVGFSHLPYVCANDTLFFNNTSPAITGSYWDFGDGTVDSTLTTTQHIYTTPGQYVVSMTGLAVTTGCPATISSPVEVKALPQPAIALPDTFGCQPFTLLPVNTTPGSPLFYVWDFGDGTTSTSNSGSHIYPMAGQFPISLKVTDFFGCENHWEYSSIQVHPKPEAAFEVVNSEQCKTPTILNFNNQSINADAYQWSFGAAGASMAINPVLNISVPGAIPVVLFAQNQYGCKDTVSRSVPVYTEPLADFSVPTDIGCQPFPVFFENNSQGVNQFQWRFGDGASSQEASPVHVYTEAGVFSVRLYVSADSICFDSLVLPNLITVQPAPGAAFTYEAVNDTTITPNGIIRFWDNSANAIRWHWDFGDTDTSNVQNPVHRYYVNGPHAVTLIVYNVLGCTDTVVQYITPDFFGGLYIPNALSPESGEPGEREFKAIGLGLEEYQLSVYASNGQLVWQSSALDNGQPSEGWNGQLNNTGELLPQGVYWWKARARFENGRIWRGMSYEGQEPVTEGKVLLVR